MRSPQLPCPPPHPHHPRLPPPLAGKLLLSAALVALGISTALACVWPIGTLDDVPVEGLTRSDYKLWPLWIWIFCIICWFIQVRAPGQAGGWVGVLWWWW